jgi:hypothetical protein
LIPEFDGLEVYCEVGLYVISVFSRFIMQEVRIKVLERNGVFVARPNGWAKSPDLAADPEGRAPPQLWGHGTSEVEALQQCIERVMVGLRPISEGAPDEIEWVDPLRF